MGGCLRELVRIELRVERSRDLEQRLRASMRTQRLLIHVHVVQHRATLNAQVAHHPLIFSVEAAAACPIDTEQDAELRAARLCEWHAERRAHLHRRKVARLGLSAGRARHPVVETGGELCGVDVAS